VKVSKREGVRTYEKQEEGRMEKKEQRKEEKSKRQTEKKEKKRKRQRGEKDLASTNFVTPQTTYCEPWHPA